MRTIFLLIILCCFSCNNERVLQLPEIENAEVTEVLDVSPAYIFYDETQPDSTLLNRKNLIITTNWLVNVDKRLTLKQAIPHIKFLQDKKRNAKMHKNEDAKNYFTCNDISIGNLGFVEFTDVNYINENSNEFYKKVSQLYFDRFFFHINIKENKKIEQLNYNNEKSEIDFSDFIDALIRIKNSNNKEFMTVVINFENSLSFQDYISIKSELSKLENKKIIIGTNEFIY